MNYLTVREAAEICGMSDYSIREAISSGRLRSYRLGGRGRHNIKPEDLAHALGESVKEIERRADEIKAQWG